MLNKTQILLVDDHPLVRRGIAELINGEPKMQVCGEAATLAEAYSQVAALKPDLVIVDVTLEGNNGVELTKELCHRWPNLAVLAYSMHEEELYAERLLRAGAKGYVMKRNPPETLLEAIAQVLKGKIYLSDAMSDRMLGKMVGAGSSEAATHAPIDQLSDRELEVFQLIGAGSSTAQIADKLCLSVKTIETYRDHIKQKLNLKSGTELVRRAVEWSVRQS
jgi:DNA-binding NarL/FixJ family response regulator